MSKEKICRYCKKSYPATPEFFHRDKRSKGGLHAACKVCLNRKKRLEYHASEAIKKVKNIKQAIYQQNRLNIIPELREKYNQYNKEYQYKRYYQDKQYKQKILKRCKEYRQTENGKISQSRHSAKRQQELGFKVKYPNPFVPEEKIDWHHINDKEVVAIPRDLHKLYGGPSREIHRENINYIIEQIYYGELICQNF